MNLLSTMGMFLDVLFKELLSGICWRLLKFQLALFHCGIAGDLAKNRFAYCMLCDGRHKGESKLICLERIQTEWSFGRLVEILTTEVQLT